MNPPLPAGMGGGPDEVPRDDDAFSSTIADPFDPMKATAPTRQVGMAQVVDLLHHTHAPETIEVYATAMSRGERFPPISVLPCCGRMFITDGHKRFGACKALGFSEITVELWTVRRLVADLNRQSKAHLGAAWTALSVLSRGPDGRREARRFAAQTVAHWRRTASSLWSLFTRR